MKENWYCSLFGHNFKNVYDEKSTLDGDAYAKIVRAVSDEVDYQSDKVELIEQIPTELYEKKHMKTYCKRCGKVI
jgi:hypothetical protein